MKSFASAPFKGLIFVLMGVLPFAALQADPVVNEDPVIELPRYFVQDTRELPPPGSWRYARVPGFEVLSNAGNSSTARLLRDFDVFRMALGVAWPINAKNSESVSLIICGRGRAFDQFSPVAVGRQNVGAMTSFVYRTNDSAAIVLDLESSSVNIAISAPAGEANANAELEIDHYKQFYRAYIQYVFNRCQPRPPAWLVEGVAQIAMRMDFTRNSIVIGNLDDSNTDVRSASVATNSADAGEGTIEPDPVKPVADRDFNIALNRQALIGWEKFFAHDPASLDKPDATGNYLWAKQAYAFVHMCMYGRGKRYQAGLLRFVDRAGVKPVSEAMFKECFGLGYKKMMEELRGYIGFTDFKYEVFNAKKGGGFPEPPPVVLRDATDGEVGRIKGDALLMAGRSDEARLAFLAPYVRGARDPALLASFGLLESVGKREDKARKLLEAAVGGKTTRARAYVELARLRMGEVQREAAATGGKLAQRQMVGILEAAFGAREHQPALPETYEVIADAWSLCVVSPKRQHLAVLDEGVRLFPDNCALLYKIAALRVRCGYENDALPLIEHSLKTVKDADLKARFEQLRLVAGKASARDVSSPAVPSPGS